MGYDKITYFKFDDEKRAELIEKLRTILESDGRVRLACVFGSFSRGNALRDLDVAVYAAPPLSLNDLLEIGAKIEIELGVPTDLAQLQDLSPSLRYEVLRRGLLVVSKDGELRHRLLAQAFSELQDLNLSR